MMVRLLFPNNKKKILPKNGAPPVPSSSSSWLLLWSWLLLNLATTAAAVTTTTLTDSNDSSTVMQRSAMQQRQRDHRRRRDRGRFLSTNFAGYQTLTVVTDEAALAHDQEEIMNLLAFDQEQLNVYARHVYERGGFSESFATVYLKEELPFDLAAGTLLEGQNFAGDAVTGKALHKVNAGGRYVDVLYPVQDGDLTNYMTCQVGGRPDPVYDECFVNHGTFVDVHDHPDQPLAYQYRMTTDNHNGRSLQFMASPATWNVKFRTCNGCPFYKEAQKYNDYYANHDFMQQMIEAALDRRKTALSHGDMDFTKLPHKARWSAVDAVTAYLVMGLHVQREMEFASRKCAMDCHDGWETCNYKAVYGVDAAVAFYTGARIFNNHVKDHGNFYYHLAQEECVHFGTCLKRSMPRKQRGNATDSSKAGIARINHDIMELFVDMQQHMVRGECVDGRQDKDKIVRLMHVPAVQGILRAAYAMDKDLHSDAELTSNATDHLRGHGAALTAIMLPYISACHGHDANLLYENMHTSAYHTRFHEVKEALEHNYVCLGITCEQVGGLKEGGELTAACVTPKDVAELEAPKHHYGHIFLVVGLPLILFFSCATCCYCLCCRRRGRRLGGRRRRRRRNKQQREQPRSYRDSVQAEDLDDSDDDSDDDDDLSLSGGQPQNQRREFV